MNSLMMIRPVFVMSAASLILASALSFVNVGFAEKQAPPVPTVKTQNKLKSALSRGGVAKVKRLASRLLSPLEYRVAFESGTERAFTNRYWKNNKPGIYVDLISGKPLFSSAHKFKSGTGWPSFDRTLSDEVEEVVDNSHGMRRVEVRSKTSGIHLGHVFEDGPSATTGRRFCINSASLIFIPLSTMRARGYGAWIERAGLN